MRDFMHGTSAKVLLAVVFVMLALMLLQPPRAGRLWRMRWGWVAPMQRVKYHYHKQRRCCSGAATYSKEELLEENAALKRN